MIEHESSEVTNRDDYHSEELGSEEDIPVEIIAEDNYSEHSSREDDIPHEGDFEDDIYDVIIWAEVTAERETPDYASERDDIPEEIVTEGDASENMVDNKNDIIADEVREESIFPADYLLEIDIVTENKDDENYEDNFTEAVEIIEEAIYENEGCLDDFAIECQRISMINIPDVFQWRTFQMFLGRCSWKMFHRRRRGVYKEIHCTKWHLRRHCRRRHSRSRCME